MARAPTPDPDVASFDELMRAIPRVNPTDRGLPPAETARRYAVKARLQSALIRRFGDRLTVGAEDDPGIVLLTHALTGRDAGHARLDALDPDARAWVESQRDEVPDSPAAPAAAPRRGGRDEDPVADARRALRDYDYEAAIASLRPLTAHRAARALLLEILVSHLDRCAEARALPRAPDDDAITRRWLAEASARTGDAAGALSLAATLPDELAIPVLEATARAALAHDDLEATTQAVTLLGERAPRHPSLGALAARRAERVAALIGLALGGLADAGDDPDRLAEAARRVRALAPAHPALSSAEARLLAHRAEARGQERLARARAAATSAAWGELGRLLGELPPAERAEPPWRDLEARLTQASEAAALATLAQRLDARRPDDLTRALAAEPHRAALAAQAGVPELAWPWPADRLATPQGRRSVAAAIAAIGAPLPDDPVEAWSALAAHAEVLALVPEGAARVSARREACDAALEQRSADWEDAARAALADGDPDRAARVEAAAVTATLPPALRARRDALRVALRELRRVHGPAWREVTAIRALAEGGGIWPALDRLGRLDASGWPPALSQAAADLPERPVVRSAWPEGGPPRVALDTQALGASMDRGPADAPVDVAVQDGHVYVASARGVARWALPPGHEVAGVAVRGAVVELLTTQGALLTLRPGPPSTGVRLHHAPSTPEAIPHGDTWLVWHGTCWYAVKRDGQRVPLDPEVVSVFRAFGAAAGVLATLNEGPTLWLPDAGPGVALPDADDTVDACPHPDGGMVLALEGGAGEPVRVAWVRPDRDPPEAVRLKGPPVPAGRVLWWALDRDARCLLLMCVHPASVIRISVHPGGALGTPIVVPVRGPIWPSITDESGQVWLDAPSAPWRPAVEDPPPAPPLLRVVPPPLSRRLPRAGPLPPLGLSATDLREIARCEAVQRVAWSRSLVAAHPTDPGAALQLAHALLDVGAGLEALALVEALHPIPRVAEPVLARALLATGVRTDRSLPPALAVWVEALDQGTGDGAPYVRARRAASAALAQGDPEGALRLLAPHPTTRHELLGAALHAAAWWAIDPTLTDLRAHAAATHLRAALDREMWDLPDPALHRTVAEAEALAARLGEALGDGRPVARPKAPR